MQEVQPVQAEDLTQEEMEAIKGYVGGNEQYAALMDWAGSTLDANYIHAFLMISFKTDQLVPFQLAVRGLMAEYENHNGYEGRMLMVRLRLRHQMSTVAKPKSFRL